MSYKADVEYPLPMIYQSGYLTIKEYDRDLEMFLLDFPNSEVQGGEGIEFDWNEILAGCCHMDNIPLYFISWS